MKRASACLLIVTMLVSASPKSEAYSVMSHQAIIDTAWESDLKPAIRKRYPNATEPEIDRGLAYAYGGAIIQDLGYYPYGNKFFSDLTHYVRSGDFVLAMLRDAQDVYEYAFALGAMAHYAADNNGHRVGTNRAVPVLYPRLRHKFGDFVTYEEDKLAHAKTEFGFDVLEVAKERYAPESYHDFVGFEVAPRVLEEAFEETYGLDLRRVLGDENKVLGSYRHAVSKLLPKATRIAWHLKKDEIQADQPGMTKRQFLYNLKKAKYGQEWGTNYQKPTLNDRFLAFLYKLLPKFGPLKILQFKTPTPETEMMFEASFNQTLDQYRALLKEQRESQSPELNNGNFDTGGFTAPGQYRLSDFAHAKLLDELAGQKYAGMTAEIREELVTYFASADSLAAIKKDKKAWAKLQTELSALKNQGPAQQVAGSALSDQRPVQRLAVCDESKRDSATTQASSGSASEEKALACSTRSDTAPR